MIVRFIVVVVFALCLIFSTLILEVLVPWLGVFTFLSVLAAVGFYSRYQQTSRDEIVRASIAQRWIHLKESLVESPTDATILRKMISFAQQYEEYSEEAYGIGLRLVELDHSKQFKIFALEAGRVFYGGKRIDGSTTVDDEAAIENDIKARC